VSLGEKKKQGRPGLSPHAACGLLPESGTGFRSLSPSLYLSHTYTHTYILSHIHTHTHTYTHTYIQACWHSYMRALTHFHTCINAQINEQYSRIVVFVCVGLEYVCVSVCVCVYACARIACT
jgi:hypothetical protein